MLFCEKILTAISQLVALFSPLLYWMAVLQARTLLKYCCNLAKIPNRHMALSLEPYHIHMTLPNSILEHLTVAVAVAVARAPENLKLAGNLPKMAVMCGLQNYKKKKHILLVFKLSQIIPITNYYAFFLGLLDKFYWQPPFLVAHFGSWTLSSEAISAG